MHIGKGSSLSYVALDRNVCVSKGVNIGRHNGTPEEREEILKRIFMESEICANQMYT